MAEVTSLAVGAAPMDAYTNFLLAQLFNHPNNNAQEKVQEAINPRTADDGKITGILSFREEKTGRAVGLPTYDVVIFCDEKRLFPLEGNTNWVFDSVLEDTQKTETLTYCKKSFMYAQRFERHADSIQICPWFLQYIKSKKYHTNEDLTSYRARLAVAGIDKLITKAIYKPIDLMSLWDKCMLHEMMHTKSGMKKNDVGGTSGYGWKNCKKLSTGPKWYDNADSYAILGNALYWNSKGSEINSDGKFTIPPLTAKRRNWLGSGAGRGLDAIKLDATKQLI
ncbi:hypothetical protein GGR53DRAFT_516504 [Hypoxylon sp. FL1150]|nr:hypothetical protein GGR53DRAFT_516504 [Hypoxylon sp. FL1150]